MPGITEATLAFFELTSIIWSNLLAPWPNGLLGDGEAPFGQQLVDLTEAEAEAMVEPHGVADNFRGKPSEKCC